MANIILIAAAGAGKGTQARLLKEKYNIAHISTGDLLRDIASSGSELGKEIAEIQKSGLLVSNELTLKILLERLEDSDCKNGFILDGYPRTLEQAKMFEEAVAGTNKEITNVIVLDVPKDMLMQRITGRLTCKACGEIYNEYFDNFVKEGTCNKCSGELFKRSDDNEEAFNKRYDLYLTVVKGAIEFYKGKGILDVVDASISKSYTFSQIEKILEDKND
ncbi:MAG TPA: nucleoside monophosphate kinase [Mollicutes bacterium]|jgi:adenylate kinase|nr:nucleoside monophosphate kinase [Mollicutes bacterium]